MNIRPLHDRVVVRRNEIEATTAGGIVLPGSAKEKSNEGEVVAVGPGRLMNDRELNPLTVKVGDKVIFGGFPSNNNTIKLEDCELIIMSEAEIFGILED